MRRLNLVRLSFHLSQGGINLIEKLLSKNWIKSLIYLQIFFSYWTVAFGEIFRQFYIKTKNSIFVKATSHKNHPKPHCKKKYKNTNFSQNWKLRTQRIFSGRNNINPLQILR